VNVWHQYCVLGWTTTKTVWRL